MEDLKTIVKDTTARISYICHGIVYYDIKTTDHIYQLGIDSMDDEFKTTYLYPEYKSITLMRWIRKAIENDTLIILK